MRSQRFSLGVPILVAACLFSLSAHASNAGITGRSGKQGPTCMQAGCHGTSASPTAPTVTLTGPTSLVAGATGNYSLVITGGPAVKGGMNVAVDSGTLQAAGADLQVVSGELIHKGGKAFSGNTVQFDFSMVAPSTAGSVKIFYSGNSTNGDTFSNGDNAVSSSLTVQVTAPTNPGPGDGEEEEEEEEGGCSAAGGSPMLLLLAVVAARLRRRS